MRPVVKRIAQVTIMFGLMGIVGRIVSSVDELTSGTFPAGLYILGCAISITLAGVVVILAEIAERLEGREEIKVPTANPTSIIAR